MLCSGAFLPIRSDKTPDFRVFRDNALVAYCETKHIEEDDWLAERLRKAGPVQIVDGSRPDPILNRLTAHITGHRSNLRR
jgi:hypothetical protein